ncbi:MAG: hypothetical protein M3O71_09715 [Bacteroidota bacterium]|nr:hypothetical protein [Bacteroidota bacterium]
MQTKILKSGGFLVNAIQSDRITSELILQLKKLLASSVYLTYKTSYAGSDFRHELNLGGQLEFIFGRPSDANAVKNIRLASNIWNNMELINRLTVLDAYAVLYNEALATYSPVEKTILFCQIFINDFVAVITSH